MFRRNEPDQSGSGGARFRTATDLQRAADPICGNLTPLLVAQQPIGQDNGGRRAIGGGNGEAHLRQVAGAAQPGCSGDVGDDADGPGLPWGHEAPAVNGNGRPPYLS